MSLFRVIGDEIEYEFRPIAKFILPEFACLRDEVREALGELGDYEHIYKEKEEALSDLEEGYTSDIAELESKIDDLQQKIQNLKNERDEWKSKAKRVGWAK